MAQVFRALPDCFCCLCACPVGLSGTRIIQGCQADFPFDVAPVRWLRLEAWVLTCSPLADTSQEMLAEQLQPSCSFHSQGVSFVSI